VTPRRSQSQAAEDARAARTRYDNDPPPKPARKRTRFVMSSDARHPQFRWECWCGADSWRNGMTQGEARRDYDAHVRESPLHRAAGWYEPKVTR
jgi:hypothetical protein